MPIRKKKAPKVLSRRARTGFGAAPTDSFHWFLDYIRLEVDKKDITNKIKSYIKASYPKSEASLLVSAPEWAYTSCFAAAAAIHWDELGKPFPEKWNKQKTVDLAIDNIRYWANAKKAEKEEAPKVVTVSKSPMEIIKERTSDFIAQVEEVLDMFNTKTWCDWDNYSVYNELKKDDAAYNIAKGTYDYYLPQRDELEELVTKKTPDLVEAYAHLGVRKQKQYLNVIQAILDDCERYMASKKAVRKSRKPRVKSADKQVEKVQYLKESSEYKVTSVHPNQIIGSGRVYLFNTKQRILTELVCRLPSGFEVSGTTIKGLDEEASRAIRLRKPLDFLPLVLSKTARQIDKEWTALTTKNQAHSGRINKDTIILRTLDK